MDRPAPIHLKEMFRIIRYVLETKRYGLQFYPKRCSWFIQALSDSDFAGDRETRKVFMDTLYISVQYQLHGKAKV